MINIKFVEGDEAVDILLNSDKYFKIMTPQERCIRMGIEYDPDKPISCDEFSEYAKKQVRTFSDAEKKRISKIVKDISNHLVSNGDNNEEQEKQMIEKLFGKIPSSL
jgi:hypothetical protein